jgi:hypothetical protein
VFAAGETEKQITVMILQDNLPEPDERLEVILDSPKEGLVLGDPHKGKIYYYLFCYSATQHVASHFGL